MLSERNLVALLAMISRSRGNSADYSVDMAYEVLREVDTRSPARAEETGTDLLGDAYEIIHDLWASTDGGTEEHTKAALWIRAYDTLAPAPTETKKDEAKRDPSMWQCRQCETFSPAKTDVCFRCQRWRSECEAAPTLEGGTSAEPKVALFDLEAVVDKLARFLAPGTLSSDIVPALHDALCAHRLHPASRPPPPSAETPTVGRQEFFAFDGVDNVFELFFKADEARARALGWLEEARVDGDRREWPEGIEGICWGRVIAEVQASEPFDANADVDFGDSPHVVDRVVDCTLVELRSRAPVAGVDVEAVVEHVRQAWARWNGDRGDTREYIDMLTDELRSALLDQSLPASDAKAKS